MALALLAACVGLLLLLAKLSGGEDFMRDVIRMQFLGRMDGTEGSSGVLYYFTSSIGNYALAYPVALLVLLAVALRGRRAPDPALQLVLYCAAAGLLVREESRSGLDRKSTRLNSSHNSPSRMPSSA